MRAKATMEIHRDLGDGLRFPFITEGQYYVVCSIEYDSYRVVDGAGEPILVPASRFEVIDGAWPSWAIKLREEPEMSLGPGMFLVPGFFERWHEGDQRFHRLFELEYARLLEHDAHRNGPL